MQNFNNPNNGLPVHYNQVDPTCINNNLPGGNDRVPSVQLSPWLNANQQVGLLTIGLFRGMAQTAAQKSAIHCFAYNLLAQNGFNNQVYQQWCQTAIDFCEFLVVVRGYTPQDAVNKAAQCTLESVLGVAFHTYPVLQQVTPNNLWAGLQKAQQMYQQITNDIRQFRSGNYGNALGNGNLPPINVGQPSHYGHQQSHYGAAQVSGQSMLAQYNNQPAQQASTGPASGTVHNSLYDVPAYDVVKPLTPKEEISTDTDYFGVPIQQESKPMQSFPQTVQVEETNLPVPTGVDDVVVDPTYYQPNGFKLDINRAYDLIHNPGGILIKPAQLVDWEITVGDDAPWPELKDPKSYCLFLVKFPDGTVKEKFVEWTTSMDYLRHELDAEMRRKAYRPNGIVVSSATPISTIGGDPVKADELQSLVQDGHIKRSSVPPVILPMIFQGANDLEVEMQVQEELSNIMEVNFSDDIPMPAVEYRSAFLNPLPITDEAFTELDKLLSEKNLAQLALGLRDLTLRGVISIRVLRVLNERLTKAVNAVLTDGMCQTVQIDDFCEDYVALEDYLEQNRGVAMRRVLQGAAVAVINRAMTITSTDNGDDTDTTIYHVVDNFINHQVGWDLDDLVSLNLRSGKAALISSLAHPVILEVLKGMISRSNTSKDTFAGVMRLITRDGYYLEVLKGRLIENATLLKLVK